MKEKPSGFPDTYCVEGVKFHISPFPYHLEGKDEPYRMIVEAKGDEYGKTLKRMVPESEIRRTIKDNHRKRVWEIETGIRDGELVAQIPLFHGEPLKDMPNPERYPPAEVPITQEPKMIVTHGVQAALHPFSSWKPYGQH